MQMKNEFVYTAMKTRTGGMWAFCVVLLSILVAVYGDFELEVLVSRYENLSRGGKGVPEGQCCDGNCGDPCDNHFTFCMRPSETNDTDPRFCPLGRFVPEVTTGDSELFIGGDVNFLGLPNPLSFGGSTAWLGSAQLYITVIDVDPGTDDVIDVFFIDVVVTVGARFTPVARFEGDGGFARFELGFRVNCADNFFGLDCTIFCVARDDDELGHYTCDSEGSRVCREGYQDPSSNCVECIPAEGCSSLGGYCNESGQCICYDGYTGDNCDDMIVATGGRGSGGDSQGGAIAGGIVGGVAVLVITVGVVVLVLVHRRRQLKTLSLSGRDKRFTDSDVVMPGDNPTYMEGVQRLPADDGGQGHADSSHSYEYIATNAAARNETEHYATTSNRTYCYVESRNLKGVGKQPQSSDSTVDPVRYETMASFQEVDPASHYEFDVRNGN